MISLKSIRSQGGGVEWKCSKCQYCWDAQDPFSGCPQCRGADLQTDEPLVNDFFSTGGESRTAHIQEIQEFTCHVERVS